MNRENVLNIINRYYNQYNLPELSISDGEIDALLSNIAKCFKESDNKEIEAAINIIIRRAINLAFLDDCDRITMLYVINALDDLRAFSIPYETIDEMKYNIMYDGLKNNAKKEKTNIK